MRESSDYAQQTRTVNVIDDFLIYEFMRIICYNQVIYEDARVEYDEYAGLTLGVIHNMFTTIDTVVKPMYGDAAVLIIDNDGKFVKIGQYN